MNQSSRPFRCQAGDLVMIVRARNSAYLGRIGVIVCGATSAAAMALSRPDELSEVQRRDWVVDLHGTPEVTYRDGQPIVTNRLAFADVSLRPLRAAPEDVECEIQLVAGGTA